MRIREPAAAAIFAALLAGCSLPAAAPDDLSAPATPLPRLVYPRGGVLGYRLEAIRGQGDDVRVDLTVLNGTGTPCKALGLRVIALGPAGQRRAVRLPVGAVGKDESRRVSARFPSVGFPVVGVSVELLDRI